MIREEHGTFRCNEGPRLEMRRLVEDALGGGDLPAGMVDDLVLALWEACTQATRHSGEPEVDVTIKAGKHAVEIEILNPGVYRVDGETSGARADQRLEVALTMAMEMSLVDEIHVDPGTEENPRTLIRMVKLIGA